MVLPALPVVILMTLAGPPPDRKVPVIESGGTPAEAAALGLAFYGDGDYEKAAYWLGLVAPNLPDASAAADFALADMYERGAGVPLDLKRAYALYLYSTGHSDQDLYHLGRAAMARVAGQLSAEDERDATMMASYGLRDGLTPQTVPLEGGGWLEITREHLVVEYQGQRGEADWAGFGGPVEEVAVHRVQGSGAVPGYLVEALTWQTGAPGDRVVRTLLWQVYEISGAAIGLACYQPLIVVHGLLVPPPPVVRELRALAELRRDGQGQLVCEPPRTLPDDLAGAASR